MKEYSKFLLDHMINFISQCKNFKDSIFLTTLKNANELNGNEKSNTNEDIVGYK